MYPAVFHHSGDRAADSRPRILDWEPMIRAIIADRSIGIPTGEIAARFHRTLAAMIVNVARASGLERVALTGGCFQNAKLTQMAIDGLTSAGFRPYVHQRFPPNDGGIALGQIAAAAYMNLL